LGSVAAAVSACGIPVLSIGDVRVLSAGGAADWVLLSQPESRRTEKQRERDSSLFI
jgi:hypothetical protein